MSEKKGFLWNIYTSGASVSVANIATLPMDVVKVRLQLQQIAVPTATPAVAGFPTALSTSPGLVMTGVNLVKEEGPLALYKGLSPAVMRGLCYGGVRLGCYEPMRGILGATKENDSVIRNVAAGSLSGSLAAFASNPLDLVKTRLQAKNTTYNSSADVIRTVVREQGLKGLWNGTVPSVARAAVLTASQCATYGEAKKAYMKLTGSQDGLATQVGASMVSGLVTTTLTAPVDVIKTNMFASGSKYSGPVQCAQEIVYREGIRGLLKGWTAQYVRLGPQTMVIFLVMEKLRQFHGMDAL